MSADACPCGLPATYAECCGRFHAGDAKPATAERLMRSRYSAFSVGNAAYLLETWHPAARPAELDLDRRTRWTGLEILETSGGSAFETEGTVRFRAHFTERGRPGQMEEHSRFVVENGRWLYLGKV
jgi:SEC-C motif-containing protein